MMAVEAIQMMAPYSDCDQQILSNICLANIGCFDIQLWKVLNRKIYITAE